MFIFERRIIMKINVTIGDNFVDFGIFDTNDDRNFDFINGYKNTAILDFNVDGNILNYF